MKIKMISHSTLLIELDHKKILTDPWLIDPLYFGRLRHNSPIPAPEEILPVDILLISHGHQDHCDAATLAHIPKNIPVIIFAKHAKIVKKLGFDNLHPVKSGDELHIHGIKFKVMPGQHPGGIVTFLISGAQDSVFFGGDSVLSKDLETAAKEQKPDAAILPISGGGFGPLKFHAGPQDAALLAKTLQTKMVIPSHYHFTTGSDFIDRVMLFKPNCLEDFKKAMQETAPEIEFKVLDVAEVWEN